MTGVPRYKTFEGKRYHFDTSWYNKNQAKARAKNLRSRNQYARIVKASKRVGAAAKRWLVYYRGK